MELKGLMADAISKKLSSFYQKHLSLDPGMINIYLIDNTIFVCYQSFPDIIWPFEKIHEHCKEVFKNEMTSIIESVTGRQVTNILSDTDNQSKEWADIFVLSRDLPLIAGPNYFFLEDEEYDEWYDEWWPWYEVSIKK